MKLDELPEESGYQVKEVPGKSGRYVKIYTEQPKRSGGHVVRERQDGKYGGLHGFKGNEVVDEDEVSASEKRILCAIVPESPELPYPLRELRMWRGKPAMEYVIPEEAREKVLKDVYPFEECPALSDELFDIHEEKMFMVKDFKVIRQFGRNLLVSPYFAHSGGMVVDWMDRERLVDGVWTVWKENTSDDDEDDDDEGDDDDNPDDC